MNRRGFLKLFGGAGLTAAVAPTYFFAPKKGWVAPGITIADEDAIRRYSDEVTRRAMEEVRRNPFWGMRYYHVSANAGSYAGLERSPRVIHA
jgi:hypothetical protein